MVNDERKDRWVRYMRPHLQKEAKQALQTDVEADKQDDNDYVKDKL